MYGSEKPFVLVVDDDAFMADLMRELLTSEFDVRAITDPVDAFFVCRDREPALIVLDLLMPGLDGESFAREWRRREGGETTPIVVVSSRADACAVAQRIGAGCLPKPFELGMLERIVEHHLGFAPDVVAS